MKIPLFIKQLVIVIFVVNLIGCGVKHKSSDSRGKNDPPNGQEWSIGDNIVFNDGESAGLGKDTSGLTYQPKHVEGTGYLWVVNNGASKLKRLKFDSSSNKWVASANDWELKSLSGKKLDTEAVAKAQWSSSFVYVASENDDDKSISRLSIIEYDTLASKTIREWDLTHNSLNADSVDMKVSGNKGFEGLTWIPDVDLVNAKFLKGICIQDDECEIYDPSSFGDHGEGLFAVSIEGNPKKKQKAKIYFYALLDNGGFKLVSKLSPDFSRVAGLEYDRSTGYLWVHCDNEKSCKNSTGVYAISDGQFKLIRTFHFPESHKDKNYEGIAIFPDKECVDQTKTLILADDDGKIYSTLVSGQIPCGKFVN